MEAIYAFGMLGDEEQRKVFIMVANRSPCSSHNLQRLWLQGDHRYQRKEKSLHGGLSTAAMYLSHT